MDGWLWSTRAGYVAFDELKSDEDLLETHELWLKALKNLRAGLMPPARKRQPTPEEKQQIAAWVKSFVFKADPNNPDPGRVTMRRLNRVRSRSSASCCLATCEQRARHSLLVIRF
jgi:hypothetical protein